MHTQDSKEKSGKAAGGGWSAAGFEYAARQVSHDARWQGERLRSSDVDPARYGDVAESGLFGLDCFALMVEAGHDIDGYLFLEQHLRLERAPRLGEPLSLAGTVEALVPVARGMIAQERYELRDASGRLCLETRLRGIVQPLPAGLPADAIQTMPSRTPVPSDGWSHLETKQITPGKVRTFSEDVGNDLHFDPEAARRYGFRAPLAQGVMTVVYLLGALAQKAAPARMSAQIEFLRPIFWDSAVSLWQREEAVGSGSRTLVQSRNEDGKVTANLIASTLSYA